MSLPFCQSILQLDLIKKQAKVLSLINISFPAFQSVPETDVCSVMMFLTPHSPLSLAPQMRKDLLNLALISSCTF